MAIMILLFQFPGAWGLSSISPFCMKADVYLQLAGLTFKRKAVLDPRTAPMGKLPYIEDGGARVPDTCLILEHLQARYSETKVLHPERSAATRAHQHVIIRTCEESLYFPTLYSRWIDEVGWAAMRRDFFSRLPTVLRTVVPRVARRGVRSQLQQQGIGRHDQDFVYRHGSRDIEALAELLGDDAYFGGDEPTFVDATTYAFLAMFRAPIENALKRTLEEQSRLTDYLDRMDKHLPGPPS